MAFLIHVFYHRVVQIKGSVKRYPLLKQNQFTLETVSQLLGKKNIRYVNFYFLTDQTTHWLSLPTVQKIQFSVFLKHVVFQYFKTSNVFFVN